MKLYLWRNNDRKWDWNCTYDGMALLAHVLPLSSRLYLISQLWSQINKKKFNLLRLGNYRNKKKSYFDVSPWRCIHGRGLSPGSWWSQGPPIPATRSHRCHKMNKSRKNGQNWFVTWWKITIPEKNVKIHLSTHFAAEALGMPGWLHSLQTKADSK